MSPVTLLFIYSSLRPGGTNPHAAFLEGRCRTLGAAAMPGRLFRNGSHVCAVHEPESPSRVLGVVMELPAAHAAEILISLDRYEGIGAGLSDPPSYVRQCVSATLSDGSPVICWAWLWNLPVDGMKHLRHGDALKG